MVVEIPNLFTQEEVNDILDKLSKAEFIDGKKTAGWNARGVKNNQQLKKNDPTAAALKEKVKSTLSKNLLFQSTVRPKPIHTMLFSRYEMGMSYGRHTHHPLCIKWPPLQRAVAGPLSAGYRAGSGIHPNAKSYLT